MNGGADDTSDDLCTVIRAGMDLMDGGEGGMSVSANVALVDDGEGTDDDATVIETVDAPSPWCEPALDLHL